MVMVACSLTCCCCVSLDEIRTEIVSGKEFAKRIMMLLDWIGNYEKDCVGRSVCTLELQSVHTHAFLENSKSHSDKKMCCSSCVVVGMRKQSSVLSLG